MALSAYRHSRKRIAKAHYKQRTFNVRVRVVRDPVYVRGHIFGRKVKKEPAYRAYACIHRGEYRKGRGCSRADAHSPSAVKKALAKLSRTIR